MRCPCPNHTPIVQEAAFDPFAKSINNLHNVPGSESSADQRSSRIHRGIAFVGEKLSIRPLNTQSNVRRPAESRVCRRSQCPGNIVGITEEWYCIVSASGSSMLAQSRTIDSWCGSLPRVERDEIVAASGCTDCSNVSESR